MPKYLIRARYTDQGARGLAKEGAMKRRDSAEGPVRQMGGTVEAYYFALGEDDAVLICDLPNNVSAAAIMLAVNASGAMRCKTTALLTAEEMDEACRKRPDFSPPGA